ncbi:DUF2059 domain-containing protein [Niveibacterium terrae]|uniref:DUF2059 domain-containing protein n=1 Tax=Niveibacterium terrae TaxID=3373598 RepID=UPI003A953603
MKLPALLAAALLCFASLAHADEASHRKAVEDLLDTIHAESLVSGVREQVIAQFVTQMKASSAKEGLNEAQKETMQRFVRGTSDLIGETLSWPKMKAFQIAVYTQTYSEAEIRELIVFYKTPLGQKMLESQPKLAAISMKEMQGQIQGVLPKMMELGREATVELQKQATPAKK